jgi:hydrogenase-4 component E
MHVWLELTVVLLILANLRMLGTSRVNVCIQSVAIQAILLAAAALLVNVGNLSPRLVGIVLFSTVLKGWALPTLLRRALRESGASREVEPFIGFTTSLLVGAALLGLCFYLAAPLARAAAITMPGSGLLIPVALFTIITGLMIIVSRRKAVTQVAGYLTLENGIYAFGMAFVVREPLLVEMGVLLDVFAAVFVMGITIYHINREFDHMDTDRLASLRD